MELVYLWVEDYKNIHRQGFNFSPRFTCNYDEDSNELTIDKNDDNIENFFGNNINVTAIVGKNGSGKSSLLESIEDINFLKNNIILIYKNQENYYCSYKNNRPNVIFDDKEITYINTENFSNDRESFYPKIIRIAHSEKIGEKDLSHYYFGEYSGLYGGINIERLNFYNMLEARFFVPRYINIALEYFDIFNKLKNMYTFNTLRLILKNNSTKYIRKYIDDEILSFRDYGRVQSNLNGKFCVYQKNGETLSRIQQDIRVPIEEVEINLYNKKRENIVTILENIEKIHRSQSYDDSIKKYNKYTEFDLASLIAFIEYYLKNTEPCESCSLVHDELLRLKAVIEENLYINPRHYRIRVRQSYILGFFEELKKQSLIFEKDNLLNIDEIIEAIQYIEKFNVTYFDTEGNPYIDIPINEDLKDNLAYLKIMQKIFFDYEFDGGNEKYLRIFEYDLIDNRVGSTYKSISDGEKHFIRFTIDIIYYLQTIKQWNVTPNKNQLAIFLADEPDNALHPAWKKSVIESVIDIFKNYLNMSNITVHFIFSTHSPFLLSDIPKQNIIFLDKDKNGNCKVVDGLKDKKQTFGANIHTLLSDSFFMDDGLMGEFAKGKINEIIDYLNGKNNTKIKSDEEAQKLINIIGEPIVKNQLQRVLDSKRLSKVDEIDVLKSTMAEMQKRIDKLEK